MYIYIGSHQGLWFDMIFIKRVVCFLSCWGDRKHTTSWIKSYQTTNHGRFFLSHTIFRTILFFGLYSCVTLLPDIL
jgi:hypothetical protein